MSYGDSGTAMVGDAVTASLNSGEMFETVDTAVYICCPLTLSTGTVGCEGLISSC